MIADKASFWFLFCSFVQKGIFFIPTPVLPSFLAQKRVYRLIQGEVAHGGVKKFGQN